MKIIRAGLRIFALCATLRGASFRDEFAVVFIDAASEAKLGDFPFDRSVLAKAIRQAASLQARGVVLKFFLDLPKPETGDLTFAQALKDIPLVLQARIDDSEVHPNLLPQQFILPDTKAQTEVSGRSGWIPLPMFSAKARDVGFVDFASTKVPMLETYHGSTVKSLVLCCLELAAGKPAIVEPGQKLKLGDLELRLDSHNCIQTECPSKDDLSYIPFHDFIAGVVPMSQIKGKVVIIGYDGPKIHSVPSPLGQIHAHRFFIYALRSAWDQLQKFKQKEF